MKGIVAAGALLATASAGNLKLTWNDCGDSSTKAKITSFSPSELTLGQTTTMIGTGNLVEDVTAANFDVEMNGAFHLLSCKGDASQSKTCGLPLGTGKLTFDAMALPIKAGQTQVKVDLTLSGSLPRALLKTTTKATATASNGDKLFCLQIHSASEESSAVSKSDLGTSAGLPPSWNPVIEKLVCEMWPENKWIEEKATDKICSYIKATWPEAWRHGPRLGLDCQTNLEKIWDWIIASCRQGRETMVAGSAHVEGESSRVSLSTEESSHAASEDGTCLEFGAKCDPKAWLPWDKCCQPGLPRTCCDLPPDPEGKRGGFVCAFVDECPSHSNEVMV